MAVISAPAGTRTQLTITALDNLASANYVSAGNIDVSVADPLDVVIEVAATVGVVAGNKQLLVFVKTSFDNTTFSTGPESGASAVDEPNLRFIGSLPANTASVLHRGAFSVMSALGYVPPFFRVIVKNDTGVALAATGHAVHFTSYTGNSV